MGHHVQVSQVEVSADRFVAFVDRLAADLDASPRRADELAAQAHLSRFHFERVIVAVAGESPRASGPVSCWSAPPTG